MSGAPADSSGAPMPVLQVVRVSDVPQRPIEWVWPGRIPRGKLTLFQGDPSVGKSFVTLDIAARVSTGRDWPDAPSVDGTPGDVVLLSAEDDIGDTIRPRLEAAGADLNRVLAVAGVRRANRPATDAFSLEDDLALLEMQLRACHDPRLVVIDPISAYLGSVDSHTNADVRRVLAPLAEIASRNGVAVVAVTHLNKSGAGRAMYRGMGSIAFVAAARIVWSFSKDKDDSSRRLMLPVKNNITKETTGLAYRLVDDGGVCRVGWESAPVTISADEALSDDAEPSESRSEVQEAAEWLVELLGTGPVAQVEIIQRGEREGFAKRTIRRAKDALGLESRKSGFQGKWAWVLPETQRVPEVPNVASP